MNYYLVEFVKGNSVFRHIGKFEYGKAFQLRVYPREGITNLKSWKKRTAQKTIIDENYKKINRETLLKMITNEHKPPEQKSLIRTSIDGDFCIGHGNTYDLITDR